MNTDVFAYYLGKMSSEKNLKIALIQLFIREDKDTNIRNALELIEKAKKNGSDLAVLPECFNSVYKTDLFRKNAEEIPNGKTSRALSQAAKSLGIYIVAGSIPELDNGEIFNAVTVWNPQGELIAKHRKIHLFDVDIPGCCKFKESDALSPGTKFGFFEIRNLKVGLGICHDSRFPELAQYYQEKGCRLIVYPGAFCNTLGPPHWKILLQARALDNQLYVAGVCSARNQSFEYSTYGHSLFINHYGQVEASTGYDEDIIYGYVDLKKLEEFRETVPILKQKRTDLYETKYHNQ